MSVTTINCSARFSRGQRNFEDNTLRLGRFNRGSAYHNVPLLFAVAELFLPFRSVTETPHHHRDGGFETTMIRTYSSRTERTIRQGIPLVPTHTRPTDEDKIGFSSRSISMRSRHLGRLVGRERTLLFKEFLLTRSTGGERLLRLQLGKDEACSAPSHDDHFFQPPSACPDVSFVETSVFSLLTC